VLIGDHPDVPVDWHYAWGRVAKVSAEPTPRVTVIDVIGRSLELDIEHIRLSED
jgi:hypothetical protein